MEKKTITRRQAIDAIKKMFCFNGDQKEGNHAKSFCKEGENDTAEFYVNKLHYERGEVIGKLQEYFRDKVIDGGQCRIDGITFVFTTLYIEQRPSMAESNKNKK